MATYHNITADDMKGFLKADKGWIEGEQLSQGVKEIVYSLPLKQTPNIHIKVYTGINKQTGASRPVGGDAIRVCAVDVQKRLGWIKSNRVHRVEGWRNNLKARILKVIEQAKARLRDQELRRVSQPAVRQVVQKQINAFHGLSTEDMRAEQEALRGEYLANQY